MCFYLSDRTTESMINDVNKFHCNFVDQHQLGHFYAFSFHNQYCEKSFISKVNLLTKLNIFILLAYKKFITVKLLIHLKLSFITNFSICSVLSLLGIMITLEVPYLYLRIIQYIFLGSC